MMMTRLASIAAGITLAACSSNPNDVQITLAPDLVSSLDGTLAVHAVALHDKDTVSNKAIQVTVDYTDRNGTAHAIAEVDGITNQRGEFDATLTGLQWDGAGTVHVTIPSGNATGDATFAVLDRTPPKLSIMAPASVHANMTAQVSVHATDEIGVSQIIFQVNGNNGGGGGNGGRSTITSGALDVTADFSFDVGQQTPLGTVFTLSALAADLSANEGVAATVMVTVQ